MANTQIIWTAEYKLPFILFREKDLAEHIGVPLEIMDVVYAHLGTDFGKEMLVKVHKKKKKDPTKTRKIHDMVPNFKAINKRIDRMLKEVALPPCFKWGVKKWSIQENARLHLGNKYFQLMDISDFFDSIDARRIRELLVRIWCSSKIARYISRFVTFDGIDPQGFPTAGTIANIYLANFCHSKIRAILSDDIVVSYWVDDIIISSKNPISHDAIGKVIQILKSAGLTVHPRKTKYLGNNTKKEGTGIRIGTTLKPTDDQLQTLETDLHLLRKDNPGNLALTRYKDNIKRKRSKLKPEEWYIARQQWLISHIKGINEGVYQRIIKRYSDVITKHSIRV